MTDNPLFFDTDCISAFLWVDETSIVTKLYGNNVMIPKQVYNELSACTGVGVVLKQRIDLMIKNGEASIVDMESDSSEYSLFSSLAINVPEGQKVIGKGEAACIALAKERNGILASNNLYDIKIYIEKYGLKHTTTADILVDAYDNKLLSEDEIEKVWADMLARRRQIGAKTFSDYLTQVGRT